MLTYDEALHYVQTGELPENFMERVELQLEFIDNSRHMKSTYEWIVRHNEILREWEISSGQKDEGYEKIKKGNRK